MWKKYMGKFRIYQSGRTNCVYCILQEVGADRKVSISGPLTLISVALQERLKEIKSNYGEVSLGDNTVDIIGSLSSSILIFSMSPMQTCRQSHPREVYLVHHFMPEQYIVHDQC